MRPSRYHLKALSVILLGAVCLLSAGGCQSSDNEQSSLPVSQIPLPFFSAVSESSAQESQQSEAPQSVKLNEKVRVKKLNLVVEDLFCPSYITVNGEIVYPKDGQRFVIAWINAENTYDELLEFNVKESLHLSIDQQEINLSGLSHVYPDYLDNRRNMINLGHFQVPSGETKKVFLMLEADKNFKKGELSFLDDGRTVGIFDFDAPPEETVPQTSDNSQTSTEQSVTQSSGNSQTKTEQTVPADGLTFTLLDLMEDEDGSILNIEQYVDVNKFWKVQLKITNSTAQERLFTINDFYLQVGDKRRESLFSSAENKLLQPGESVEGDLIFAVDKSDDNGILYYSSHVSQKDYLLFYLNP